MFTFESGCLIGGPLAKVTVNLLDVICRHALPFTMAANIWAVLREVARKEARKELSLPEAILRWRDVRFKDNLFATIDHDDCCLFQAKANRYFFRRRREI